MDHQQSVEHIDAFLNGTLDAVEWAEFLEHEGQCTPCSRQLNDRQWEGIQEGGGLAEPQPQPCLKPETLQRWVESKLDPQFRDIVSSHLAECDQCFSRADAIGRLRQ